MKKPKAKKTKPSLTSTFMRKANNVVNPSDGTTRLMQAIINDDADMAEALLQAGANPDAITKDGRSALHIAVENGHIWAATLLSKHHADMNIQNKLGQTALFSALSLRKATAMVGHLCALGASADIPDKEDKIPLHIAAETGSPDLVSALAAVTEHGYRPDKKGMQPIHYACQNNSVNAVAALLSARLPLEGVTLNGDSCLHLVLERDDDDLTDLLLAHPDAPALFNAANLDGRTPLHIAVANNNLEAVEILIKQGADPNAADKNGVTPLCEAARQNDVAIAKKLIQLGADVATKQPDGVETPLMAAISAKQPYNEMVSLLLEHNADINAKDQHGYTPLIAAVHRGHNAICNKLLDRQADANAVDFLGRNILHYIDGTLPAGTVKRLIAATKDLDNVESFHERTALMSLIQDHKTVAATLLIEAGANVNAQNKIGQTALHYALKTNHPDIAKKLLDKKADMTLREAGTGVTPLHVAAQYGHSEVVEKMVKQGADIEIKDNAGCTPLHASLMRGLASMQIVITLLNCGANPLTMNEKGYAPYDYAFSDNRTLVTALFDRHLAKKGKPRHEPRHPPRRNWWGGY